MIYEEFLRSKEIFHPDAGISFPKGKLSRKLFDFQRDIVAWALRKGRAAIFADCGLGKTLMQLEWARRIDGPVLFLAPLAVNGQTVWEAQDKLHMTVVNARKECEDSKVITNYEMMQHFNPYRYKGVVLDECFSADTPIDTPSGKKYIKDIRCGDEIINASGVDVVGDVHRREINYGIKVKFSETNCITSPNHPFFTQRGWVGARNLRPNDYLLETSAAVRLVFEGVLSEISGNVCPEILRDILFSEMAHVTTGASGESSYARSSKEKGSSEECLVQIGQSQSRNRTGENKKLESYGESRVEDEVLPDIESHEVQTFRAWGQWYGNDRAAIISQADTFRELDSGICYLTGRTETGLSDMLQGRLSECRNEDSYRSGWSQPSQPETSGCQKGQHASFVRVEGIEVLEQGHSELERYRDGNGKLYFYDIGATRHPSFSVNGILVHNSSILKNFDGKFRNQIIESFRPIPYKLACTATPSPNDIMELGNHSEFLGNLSRTEMLSTFFVHDGGETSKWRLKGHAQKDFWKWVCTWAVMLRKPSDLGYSDEGFILPELRIHEIVVDCDDKAVMEDDTTGQVTMFPGDAKTLGERRAARSETVDERAQKVAELGASFPEDQFLVWCNLNKESNAASKLLNAVEITGSDTAEFKEREILAFANGKTKRVVSKPSICGMGMNLQSCHKVAFLGLSDSYESYYQAVRRVWRFGQKHPVDCYIVTSSLEGEVVKNIKRKEAEAIKMAEEMVANMSDFSKAEITSQKRRGDEYKIAKAEGNGWDCYLGDTCEAIKEWPENSIHYMMSSWPFASLYTYSASERDAGNCRTHAEFWEHMNFMIPELYRVLKPGRLMSIHCMNLPKSKERDGVIGITDFRGDVIRACEKHGFIYHSEVCIWKDPVTAMQRTKALGLLHKQIKKDSCMSRQGIPDYLVTMRKPGDNSERVDGCFDQYIGDEGTGPSAGAEGERLSIEVWQRYASPVWMDIKAGNTLQKESAREDEDERHICPLQLQVIERGIELWSNQGDVVFDPFTGIGSTGYQALKSGRKFIGCELKESYWKQAVANLRAAEIKQEDLFTKHETIA